MTFSILARDPSNGRFGVAVATCHLAVGSTVPHIRAGVGAVATQAHTNPYFGSKRQKMRAWKSGRCR